jgi:hypothetical protein
MHCRRFAFVAIVVVCGLSASGVSREGPPKAPAVVVSDWRACKTLELDGVSTHVVVEDHSELQVSSFTLSAWVNSADIERTQPIVAKALAKGNWLSYMLRINDRGRLELAVANHADSADAHWLTKARLTSKQWHHVAATWSNECGKASDAKLYIDGVEQEAEMSRNNNYGPAFRIGYSKLPLYIGRDEFPSGHFFGTLKDVDVVGRVLTAAEIKKLALKENARGQN